jgi:hypothetical protein
MQRQSRGATSSPCIHVVTAACRLYVRAGHGRRDDDHPSRMHAHPQPQSPRHAMPSPLHLNLAKALHFALHLHVHSPSPAGRLHRQRQRESWKRPAVVTASHPFLTFLYAFAFSRTYCSPSSVKATNTTASLYPLSLPHTLSLSLSFRRQVSAAAKSCVLPVLPPCMTWRGMAWLAINSRLWRLPLPLHMLKTAEKKRMSIQVVRTYVPHPTPTQTCIESCMVLYLRAGRAGRRRIVLTLDQNL